MQDRQEAHFSFDCRKARRASRWMLALFMFFHASSVMAIDPAIYRSFDDGATMQKKTPARETQNMSYAGPVPQVFLMPRAAGQEVTLPVKKITSGPQAPAPAPEYRIRTGDTLVLSIPFEEDTRMEVPVRPDGRISYIFNIEVMAAGLTYRELHAALIKELAKYYKAPRVTVVGHSFAGNSVYVMGPVKQPGAHEIHNNTRLVDVLASAGVMSVLPQILDADEPREVIDLDGAYIARGNTILDINFRELLVGRDMSQNILLLPQDFIFVPGSEVTGVRRKVYICGRVTTPQVYRFNRTATFIEAMAAAGGPIDNVAGARECVIIRRGATEMLTIDYHAIMRGEAEDLGLEQGDIIYVPERRLRYASKAITTVIQEIMAPLQAVLDADDLAKAYRNRKW